MSAITGCSQLVISHPPRDTNRYGLNHGQSNLHIIPGGHKSKANTPSSNISLWDGPQHIFDSDRGLTRRTRILSNVPRSISRHSDDTTVASPGVSVNGPVASQGPPVPTALTTLMTRSSKLVQCRATSPT